MPTGEDGRLEPHEAKRLQVWIKGSYGTVAKFAEQHGYSTATLSRMLNRKPDGGVSINRLRQIVRQTGHDLSQLFEPADQAPRRLTIADVQAGLQQASVDMNRWATLLQEVQRQAPMMPEDEPTDRRSLAKQMVKAIDSGQIPGTVARRTARSGQEKRGALREQLPQTEDRRTGSRGK